jgi:hypothetical protein
MAKDSKGAQVDGDTGTVPVVTAGTTQKTFRVVALDGTSRDFPASDLFKAGTEVKLGDEEGVVIFVDVNDKKQVERKLKLADPKGDGSASRCHPSVLFFSETAKKYGGLVACLDCSMPVRKWTSDMHQSGRCLLCGIRAHRAHAKAKRAAKAAPTPSAQ